MRRFSAIVFSTILVIICIGAAEAQTADPNTLRPPRRVLKNPGFTQQPVPPQPDTAQPSDQQQQLPQQQTSPQPAPQSFDPNMMRPSRRVMNDPGNFSQPNQQTMPAQPFSQQQNRSQGAPIKPFPPQQLGDSASPVANNPPTIPATPPLVIYHDGLLTVQAANSSLSSVLTAIRGKTGIEFEGQENVPDRVALSLGPAPAGEVLSAIFAGSKFDFVAIGRQDNPGIVQRVIFTPKALPGAASAAVQPQPRPNNGDENGEEDTPDETPSVEPQDTPAQPPVPVPQAQTPPEPQSPKSPEQLLQQLQEMRKQQQLQQEGAPQPNPAQVPRKPPL